MIAGVCLALTSALSPDAGIGLALRPVQQQVKTRRPAFSASSPSQCISRPVGFTDRRDHLGLEAGCKRRIHPWTVTAQSEGRAPRGYFDAISVSLRHHCHKHKKPGHLGIRCPGLCCKNAPKHPSLTGMSCSGSRKAIFAVPALQKTYRYDPKSPSLTTRFTSARICTMPASTVVPPPPAPPTAALCTISRR